MADTTGPRGLLRRLLPTRARRAGDTAPRVRFTKEDARRLNERFAQLDRAQRRAIVRAVNRGEAMDRRKDAELAVGVARRQQRFWSRAWLLGPVIAVVQVLVTPIGWVEGALLAGWGALLLGMMAAWWWTRARRAELANVTVAAGRRARPAGEGTGASGAAGGRTRRRSRLPGGPAEADAAEPSAGTDDDDGRDGGGGGPRPPRPRGRKRR